MKLWGLFFGLACIAGAGNVCAQSCNLRGYNPVDGVTATAAGGALEIVWPGENGQLLQARFGLRDGQPVIGELAAQKAGGAWVELGKDLTPDFQVTTGKRRISITELSILKELGLDTPENEERYKWNVFWDAPLVVPGHSHLTVPARSASEIGRASVSYNAESCSVKSEGSRVMVVFDGLRLGLFTALSNSPCTRDRAFCDRRPWPVPARQTWLTFTKLA